MGAYATVPHAFGACHRCVMVTLPSEAVGLLRRAVADDPGHAGAGSAPAMTGRVRTAAHLALLLLDVVWSYCVMAGLEPAIFPR